MFNNIFNINLSSKIDQVNKIYKILNQILTFGKSWKSLRYSDVCFSKSWSPNSAMYIKTKKCINPIVYIKLLTENY